MVLVGAGSELAHLYSTSKLSLPEIRPRHSLFACFTDCDPLMHHTLLFLKVMGSDSTKSFLENIDGNIWNGKLDHFEWFYY